MSVESRTLPAVVGRAVAVLAVASVLALPAAVVAGGPVAGPSASTAWVPVGGGVSGLAAADGAVYVGGDFTGFAPPFGDFAVYRPGARMPERDVARARDGGGVYSVTDDGRGGWFVSGAFTSFAGLECPRLVHVFAGGAVDRRWCPRPARTPTGLVRQGRFLYAALLHSSPSCCSSTPARFDARTGRRLRWHLRLGTSRTIHPVNVWAMAADRTRVYLGGGFSSAQGHPARRLAAVDARSGRFLWGAQVVDGPVTGLIVNGGRLFVFGSFDSVNHHPRRGYAAFDAHTGRLLDWHPDAKFANVVAVVPSRGVFYLGAVGPRPYMRNSTLVAVDAKRGATLWKRSHAAPVALLGGDLLIHAAGRFFSVDPNTGRRRRWQLALPGDTWSSWPFAAAVSGSRLALGGGFWAVEPGIARSGLAALDALTGKPLAWKANLTFDPSSYNDVTGLLTAGDRLYVSGGFTRVAGLPRHGLAAVDLATGAVEPWNPKSTCDNINCKVVAATDTAVYVAGTTIDRKTIPIAAFSAASGQLLAWNPHLPTKEFAQIDAAQASGPTLYIGGTFQHIHGTTTADLAAVDANTGALLDWRPHPDGPVNALAVSGTTLYVGGAFTQIDDNPRDGLAAFDIQNGQLLPWDPGPYLERLRTTRDGPRGVTHLVASGSTVYADGIPFDAITGQPQPWTNAPGGGRAVAATDTLIYAATNDWGGLVAVPPPQSP